jgi:glutathione S-transferase
MLNYTSIVTLLAVLFYFYTSVAVGQARMKYGVKAPAVTGHPDFERLFRIQMNTLEWMPIFLPTLWLFAFYSSDKIAALLGILWIAARILYFRGYSEAAEKRSAGFGIQALIAGALFLGALAGVLTKMVGA